MKGNKFEDVEGTLPALLGRRSVEIASRTSIDGLSSTSPLSMSAPQLLRYTKRPSVSHDNRHKLLPAQIMRDSSSVGLRRSEAIPQERSYAHYFSRSTSPFLMPAVQLDHAFSVANLVAKLHLNVSLFSLARM